MPDSSLQGEFAALATAICWTVAVMSFESAGRRVGSLPVNIIRLVMATLFLAAFCGIRRGLPLPTDATWTACWILSLSGLIGFTFGDLCLFRAFVLIGSRISMLLMALVPVFSAFLGWLALGEELVRTDLLGVALVLTGVVTVILEKKNDENGVPQRLPLVGVLLGILGALGQAGGLVLSKIGAGAYDPFAATQIRIIAGTLGFALLFTIIRIWPRVAAACRNRAAMGRIGLGAVFGPFLGVSLSLMAVQHTKLGVGATIMSITPVLLIVPSIVLFKDRVTLRAVLGTLLAVSGVAVLFAAKQ